MVFWTILKYHSRYYCQIPLQVMLLPILILQESVIFSINNGNGTEWSPIWSVIIRVINKIGRPRESDLLIPSMITDGIGRHDVLLPINHNHLIITITEGFNWKKNQ